MTRIINFYAALQPSDQDFFQLFFIGKFYEVAKILNMIEL